MKYTSTFFAFLLVATLTLFGASMTPSPAIAQSSPPSSPMNVSAADGDNPGEVIITWDAVPNAAYYRIGWVNYNDYLEVTGRDRPWSEAFAFVDVANIGQTSHTITRLEPGVLHAFRVASNATEYGQPSFSGWVLLDLAAAPASQPLSEEVVIPGRPTASAECYVGQRLTAGQSCWFSVPDENPNPIFAVTNGGPYHGWGQRWYSQGFDFFSEGNHAYAWSVDGVDRIMEVGRQDSVWVVEQYGLDTEQPPSEEVTFPSRPTASAECYVGQQLTPGQSCWFSLHGDKEVFAVTNGGPYHGWGQTWSETNFRFFSGDTSRVASKNGVRHRFAVEEQDSGYVVKQYGPDS